MGFLVFFCCFLKLALPEFELLGSTEDGGGLLDEDLGIPDKQ